MSRAQKPVTPPGDDTPLHLAGEDLDTGEQLQADELGALLEGLAGGGRYFATVYRLDDVGGKQFLPGRLVVNPEEDPSELLERLAKMHGPGDYSLQLRAQGSRGTKGNVPVSIGSVGAQPHAPAPPTAAAHQAPSPEASMLRDMLQESREDRKAMMELLLSRANPPAAAAQSMDGQLGAIEKFFTVARRLSKDQQSPAIPGWLNTIGELAAPTMALLAGALTKAAAKLEAQQKPQLPAMNPPPPGARPAHTTDASATSTAEAPVAPSAAQMEKAQELACGALLVAECQQPTPDAARLARGLMAVAAAPITSALATYPDGALAAAFCVNHPDQLKGREPFAGDVERELRAIVNKATPATPAPENTDGPRAA
jgi:hypothetical protein